MGRGVEIRDFRPSDAAAGAALLRVVAPYWLFTAASLLHEVNDTPARARLRTLVAQEDGAVVGWSDALLRWRAEDPGVGHVWVAVEPGRRRRGLGSALLGAGIAHLAAQGAHTLTSSAEPGSLPFAERHGFARTRSERLWEIRPAEADLSDLPALERAKAAEGFRVVPLRELLGRPRELHALYVEAEDDIPTDHPRGELPYEEWERETLAKPLLDADLSPTVLDGDGRPVAFAWLLVDREGARAEHELTGTLRAYRGRGLARLAKLVALRWAAAAGVDVLLTGNDAENTPMLRINERLGYRPGPIWVDVARSLKPGPRTR
jgi:GNAT superfamily N-acetyltransferase